MNSRASSGSRPCSARNQSPRQLGADPRPLRRRDRRVRPLATRCVELAVAGGERRLELARLEQVVRVTQLRRPIQRAAVNPFALQSPLDDIGVRVASFAEQGGHLRFGHDAGHEKFRHAAVQRVQAAAEPYPGRLTLLLVIGRRASRSRGSCRPQQPPAASGTCTRRRPRACAGSSRADRDTHL